MFRRLRKTILICLLAVVTGCAAPGTAAPTFTPQPARPTEIAPLTPTHTPLPTHTPDLIPRTVWIGPGVPTVISDQILSEEGWQPSGETSATAQVRVMRSLETQPARQISRWVMALVAPFFSRLESLSSADVIHAWQGQPSRRVGNQPLYMTSETARLLAAAWGPAAEGAVRLVDLGDLAGQAWQDRAAWAIVPFDRLEPRWKVLRVDGVSPYDPDFDPEPYRLTVKIGLFMDPAGPMPSMAAGNRDPQKLTVLAMTGVTALARRTARTMNEKGVEYPAEEVGALLRSADLTHISNEVSFNPDCPPELAQSTDGRFCSAPEYIRLLDAVGADIIELTGNHNLDRGAEAYLYTLDEFARRGWGWFGGGRNEAEANSALVVENHGNRLAFIGCNAAGPDIAWAGSATPGAARCDLDRMEAEVRALRSEGTLPVVTFQAFETDDYMPAPMQRPGDFERMAAAGAVLVSGSQAHFPQGFRLTQGGLIHYGLGNLFFDQVEPWQTRLAFIDRHVFYAGRYLGVDLRTVVLEEYARPRWMTPAERLKFLDTIYSASGW